MNEPTDSDEEGRAMARLRDSDVVLRAIYEHAQEGILVVSADTGRFIMANPAACRLLGYSEHELLRMSPEQLHPEEALSRVTEHFQAMRRGDTELRREMPFRRKDGALFLADISASLVSILDQPCYFGVLRDVTVQARQRDALDRSEALLAEAQALAHIGSWEWDIRTGALRWTDEIYRIFGQAPQSFDATYQAFLQAIHADDRQRVLDAVDASVADAAVPYRVEHRVVRPDGTIRVVHEQGRVYREADGTPVRMVGTVQDITERKTVEAELARYREHLEDLVRERTAELAHSEAQLRRAQQIAHLGHWSVNLQTGELDWSDETYRIFGCERATFTPDPERFFQLVHADDRDSVRRATVDAFAHGTGYRADHRIVRPDGEVRWVHEEAQTETDGAGRPLRLQGTVQDITERKLAEAAILHARDEAERANRAKSEFLSRMSHELRTPLNAILGFAQLLQLEVRDPEQADNVREIMHAGHHLLDLINEVLDLARIEAGRLTLSREPVAVMPLVDECLTLVQPLADARRIRIALRREGCLHHVQADRVRLKQVLLNLLSNAIKFNQEGGEIALACVVSGESLEIRVSDTGPGLSPQQQARLFTAFERLGADQRAIEGTGIGLALSKRLTELMHGSIGVDSAPGRGSTFWVRLPAGQGMDPSMPAQSAGVSTTQAAVGPGAAPATVLCIEDNPANLRLIERVLAHRGGVHLLCASTPLEGLALAERHSPAVILLDINLPEMDGYEVMAALRERATTRDIPVVAVSAAAMPADLARGKAAGFHAYLTKPIDIDHLLHLVASLIDAAPSPAPASTGDPSVRS